MRQKIYKIMLVDDQLLCLHGLKHILEGQDNYKVVLSTRIPGEIIEKGLDLNPDILIIDPDLSDADGFEHIRILKERGFRGKILLLLNNICNEVYIQANKIKMDGYMLKSATPDKLILAVSEVIKGRTFIDEDIDKVLQKSDDCNRQDKVESLKIEDLSQREYDILKLVASGFSNKIIANQLFISEKTVKNHLTQIFRKLGVNDRVQATLFAIKHGIR